MKKLILVLMTLAALIAFGFPTAVYADGEAEAYAWIDDDWYNPGTTWGGYVIVYPDDSEAAAVSFYYGSAYWGDYANLGDQPHDAVAQATADIGD